MVEKNDSLQNIETEIDAPLQTNQEMLKKFDRNQVYKCDKGVMLDSMLDILLQMDDEAK